jgi:hypothetical protein
VCVVVETGVDAHRSVPLFATQGIRYRYQEVSRDQADENCGLSAADVGEYLEQKAQSPEQKYRPWENKQSLVSKLNAAQQLPSR